MLNKVICVIPVRLKSERFPRKILSYYKEKTILENVINIAKQLNFVDKIVVASGDNSIRIKNICYKKEITFLYQKKKVSCGTERLVNVKKNFPDYDIYMTLPCDEPAINPKEINKFYKDNNISKITTLYSDFYNYKDLLSINSCKIVMKDDNVIYTSRAIIPSHKNGELANKLHNYKRHVGVFFFPSYFLNKKELWNDDFNSTIESLEQNKFLGYNLKAYKINHIGFGIDLFCDIKELEERI